MYVFQLMLITFIYIFLIIIKLTAIFLLLTNLIRKNQCHLKVFTDSRTNKLKQMEKHIHMTTRDAS